MFITPLNLSISFIHGVGNTLTEAQVTALIENKWITGPEKDVSEVLNVIKIYDALPDWKADSEKDLPAAHKMLMTALDGQPVKYRKQGVDIAKRNAGSTYCSFI